MINSILQDRSFDELIRLRKFFQKEIYDRNSGSSRISDESYNSYVDAVKDLDEIILYKYQEETRTFTDYSRAIGN